MPRLVPIEAVNDTDSMLAVYDERMRGAAGFVAEEPETVLIVLAGDLATAAPRDHAAPGSAHTGSAGGCAIWMRDGAGSQGRLAPPPPPPGRISVPIVTMANKDLDVNVALADPSSNRGAAPGVVSS